MGSDPLYAKYPDLSLAQDIFNISNPYASSTAKQSSLKKLKDAITEHKMAPLYRHLAHPVDGILNGSGEGGPMTGVTTANGASKASAGTFTSNLLPTKKYSKADLAWDEKLYESLKADNEKELETYQKEEDEATEAAGDIEVQAARGKRAEFWARVGDKVG